MLDYSIGVKVIIKLEWVCNSMDELCLATDPNKIAELLRARTNEPTQSNTNLLYSNNFIPRGDPINSFMVSARGISSS